MRFRTLPKTVQGYLLWAGGLSLLYLLSPVVSYLIFWEVLPRVSLTLFFGGLLVPTFVFRVLLLLMNHLRFMTAESFLSFLLLCWISLLQFLWYPIVSAQVNTSDVLSTLALTFVTSWILWLGGESLSHLFIQKRRLARTLIFITYLGLMCIVLYGITKGFSIYSGLMFMALQNPISGEFYNYYIPLADSLALLGLCLLAEIKATRIYKPLRIYFVTAMLLLFTFSRASFYLFVVIGLGLLCIKFQSGLTKHLIPAIFIGTSMLILIVILFPSTLSLDVSMLPPLFKRLILPLIGSDLSVEYRLQFLADWLEYIKQHWLLGYFMIEAIGRGKGTYAHNWLSFWLSYGLGPFVLSLWIIISLLIKSWQRHKCSLASLIGFMLLAFCFLSVIVARSYTWPYIWFAIGFAGVASRDREKHNTYL